MSADGQEMIFGALWSYAKRGEVVAERDFDISVHIGVDNDGRIVKFTARIDEEMPRQLYRDLAMAFGKQSPR